MQIKSSYKPLVWNICCIAIILLSIMTFTPLVIPASQPDPALAGVPYTLWAGIATAVAMMLVNFIGTLVYPGKENEDEAE